MLRIANDDDLISLILQKFSILLGFFDERAGRIDNRVFFFGTGLPKVPGDTMGANDKLLELPVWIFSVGRTPTLFRREITWDYE